MNRWNQCLAVNVTASFTQIIYAPYLVCLDKKKWFCLFTYNKIEYVDQQNDDKGTAYFNWKSFLQTKKKPS